MRELWLWLREEIDPKTKVKLLSESAQSCSGAVVGQADVELAREAKIKTIASREDADLLLLSIEEEKDVVNALGAGKRVMVHSVVEGSDDIDAVAAIAGLRPQYVVITCPNWKVIPLEELVAKLHGKCKLLARVSDSEEARLALQALELGTDGVALEATHPDQIAETFEIMGQLRTRIEEIEKAPRIELIAAKVIKTNPVEVGARVCVDTCDIMKSGEGMLVGSQSSGLFLVEAEVEKSPLTSPRPFRVNAGSVSSYILVPGGKTQYLSEIEAGSKVLIVDRQGRTRTAVVGRAKIEWRPLILIEAESRGKKVKTVLQNAETIRLVAAKGSKAVTELEPGDEILVHVEEGGRHFGKLVPEERVIER